jgi:Domain of unknown function (DUF1707)
MTVEHSLHHRRPSNDTDVTMSNSPEHLQRIVEADREAAAELLRVAAGEGHISLAELDARLERVLTAQTSADLDGATADLQHARRSLDLAAAQSRAEDRLRLAVSRGHADRLGEWPVPRWIDLVLEHATSALDFRNSKLPQGGVHIHINAVESAIRFLVPADAYVDLENLGRHGARVVDRKGRSVPRTVPAAIRVTGDIREGSLKIRR